MSGFVAPEVATWFAQRTFDGPAPAIEQVTDLKRDRNVSISVCLPALNEEATVGNICRELTSSRARGLIDEVIVMDSGSSDATPAVAQAAGARVYAAVEVLPEAGSNPYGGKGESLWKCLAVAHGDLVVYLDSDTQNFELGFVTGLVAPLLTFAEIDFVKAFYERPLIGDETSLPGGGARVTELSVRPLINLFWQQLAGFVQPLSGEYAGRRDLLRSVPFPTGYAVDIGLLIDIVVARGLDAVAQANLGRRIHRNRDVSALGRMAFEIMYSLFTRLDDDARVKLSENLEESLIQFENGADGPRPIDHRIAAMTRPPMVTYLSL